MNKDSWYFYFDESFHDRKITVKENNINIYSDTFSDMYVGVFSGFKKQDEDSITAQYLDFEKKYKGIYGLSEAKELKGTRINKKNFKYGIQTFNKNALEFYNEFFNFLKDKNIIFHISMFSKTEFLITSAFKNLCISPGIRINNEAFIYSLIKFLFVYRDVNFLKKFFYGDNEFKSLDIINYLKDLLRKVISNSNGIPRKMKEREALIQLLYILDNSKIYGIQNEYFWDHSKVFKGFNSLLEEMHVNENNISLLVDKGSDIYDSSKSYNYKLVNELDSRDSVGIRISDILSNFIGRIVLQLDEDLREEEIKNLNTLNTFDYKTKKILNPKWFEINQNKFILYKNISCFFKSKCKYFSSIYTGVYFDYTTLFLYLINYIGDTYSTYTEFKTIDSNKHSERFNDYCIINMLERYKNLGFNR
ncbi:hypothetical protein KQI30_13535 [Clostridium bornimense]|uniref:hypothetical protein n=1 Tax=Clostridium bornimense TaxID=1216932 RepID=UPI001C120A3A|nr:hypothetical protein [Clostridium bornimense]MBU5317273.1 hypothetical protein [Clostridium bornimense]